jgi:hypothetical protein
MALVLVKVSPTVLGAVRERPDLLARILGTDAAADCLRADYFRADFDALEATAASMTTRVWFDTAVNGTEPLGFDELTYGPAFALDPADVRAVAAGLAAEGWPAPAPAGDAEPAPDVDATARSLGAAAGWDPVEFESYGPMLAATWPPGFTMRLVRAVGAAGGWPEPTTDRVLAAVLADAPAPPTPSTRPASDDLAAFFAAAAHEGKAVVGGLT